MDPVQLIGKKLKELADKIVTVRTGTIVSNYAALDQTTVVLDNDPSGLPVACQGLNHPMAAGTRVSLLAFPPRGLIVQGAMTDLDASQDTDIYGWSYGTNGVWTKPDRLLYAIFEMVGGGGGGGNATATGAGQASCGGGGGAGGYGRFLVMADDIPDSLNVVVAAASAAASTGNTSQLVNTDTLAVFLQCTGGGAGNNGGATGQVRGHSGGTGGACNVFPPAFEGGSVASSGGGGGAGFTGAVGAMGGTGGGSYFGGGARGPGAASAGSVPGIAGEALGSGGSGAAVGASAAAANGGGGQQGVVYIYGTYRD